jgi:Gpi18-like mannosyltransferase
MSHEIKRITILFLFWLISLLAISYLGAVLFPHSENHIFILGKSPNIFYALSNWDGQAYLTIAKDGYNNDNLFAFFPLYPLFVKFGSVILFNNYLLSALAISWFSLLFAIILLWKLVRLDFPKSVADKTLIYLLLFPFSFFFIATYTESLFLLATVAGFYFFRRENYIASSIFGIAATATRVIGPAVAVSLFFEMLIERKISPKPITSLLVSFLGLFSFVFYLWHIKHKAVFFIFSVQEYYERTQLTYPFKVLFSYVKNFVIHPNNILATRDSTIIAMEFFVSLIFFATIILVWKRVNKSYAIFCLISWALPLMTGRTGSMLRYVIILFPCFIVFALLGSKYPWFHKAYIFLSTLLLAIFAISFINGYWVA